MDQYKYASVLVDHVHYMRIVSSGMMASSSRTMRGSLQLPVYVRGSKEHQDEFTVPPWPANSPELNPIENLWDHLDRVVRAMDPQPRNLAQLATALESAWLTHPREHLQGPK
ncbi:transposable element Tcb1 transposase [Trichonephila clavipes]|nr:transposable element Tcb1 transposase [Trichonephila clavipes]